MLLLKKNFLSFDPSNGALIFVVIRRGVLRKGLPIRFLNSPEKEYIVDEVGILHPETTETDVSIFCNVKSI